MLNALPSWVDGAILASGVAAIPAEDQGFALGLAVFETLLQTGGHRFFEAQHLARFERSAAVLGIAWPPPFDPAAALADYGERLGDGDYAVRICLSRGSPGGKPRMVITAREADYSAMRGIAVSIAKHAKVLDVELEGTKSTSRLRNVLSREAANAEGAFDALVLTAEGDISEGTISNVILVEGDRVITPSLDRGALAGVVRGELLAGLRAEAVPVEERRVEVAELAHCSEVFLTNSISRVAPVHTVLGVRSGLPGAAGPWAIRAREIIARREAQDVAQGSASAR
jgi:branched-subunit amino acid aminotransferase/4-amino-4-deoxychorismate lyase